MVLYLQRHFEPSLNYLDLSTLCQNGGDALTLQKRN